MNTRQNVIYLRDVDPERALEALMRLTGLEWDSLPESLVNKNAADQHTATRNGTLPFTPGAKGGAVEVVAFRARQSG